MRIREATMKDIEGIQKLYWELDTDAVFYQPSRFVRTERPVGFLIDTINDAKSAILVAEDEDERKLLGFSLLQEKENAENQLPPREKVCLRPGYRHFRGG
ncbi:hypothetical protein HMSSN139_14880 [Paenibacillus sp. HMSSN-139]|nr:hypothetical protein HMSSN139_14880 [Paenibacillus sp. HMSSN-139]